MMTFDPSDVLAQKYVDQRYADITSDVEKMRYWIRLRLEEEASGMSVPELEHEVEWWDEDREGEDV